MAKNSLFVLLFFALQLTFIPIYAANEPTAPENDKINVNYCDAPAPEDFQVISIASGLVSLGWVPAWSEAYHTLTVYLQDEYGGWTTLATYSSVTGDSYAVSNLSVGSYRITNATNCTNGVTSIIYSEVFFKIIDLTTGGRIPLNPLPVANCGLISLSHEWVGFQVKEKLTGRSNLFEFQVEGLSGLVRRVANNQIVAVNAGGFFPLGDQRLEVGFSFQMDDKSKPPGLQPIGFVEISQDGSGNIGICIDTINPPVQWKPAYEFTALVAENTTTSFPPGGGAGTGQGFGNDPSDGQFFARSPFLNTLEVFMPDYVNHNNEVYIKLLDLKGQTVLSEVFNMGNSSVSIPTSLLPSGFYILQIRSNQVTEVLKVLKQ
ncbi:MAG: T9SS type A sorting domain-containing protein [Saprospiraceae bacterium]